MKCPACGHIQAPLVLCESCREAEFDPSEHPREPAGSDKGGEFANKASGDQAIDKAQAVVHTDSQKGDGMDTFETRYEAMPPDLLSGDIWSTKKRGIFVVVSTRPAQWRGEDRDVYAHVTDWITGRPADAAERARWDSFLVANRARNAQRKALGVDLGYGLVGTQLVPDRDSTRRLDSYDDRWEPPRAISLTPEQLRVEEEYVTAKTGIKGHQ